MTQDPIYDFEAPPINEALCGIAFKPLESFATPHFGVLWTLFKDTYPRFEDRPPLNPPKLDQKASPGAPVGYLQTIDLTDLGRRVWFVSEDGSRLVQVQRDRFLHNWRKQEVDYEYPRFRSVFQEFQDSLARFKAFVDSEKLGSIEPVQYELTYVNIIDEKNGFTSLSRLGDLLPDFKWREQSTRFLPKPESIAWTTVFSLPEDLGKLRVVIQDGSYTSSGQPLVRLMLTVHGLPRKQAPSDVTEWFRVAREWIVRGFVDLTSEDVQYREWRRK